MNKQQIILLSIGIGLIVIIVGGFYLLQQQSATPPTQQTSNTAPSMMPQDNTQQNTGKAMNPTISVSPNLLPQEVTRKFYSWYITYPGNVLSTGAYKTSPYITSNFKQLMTTFAANLNPNFDPVFCKVNKTNSFAVGNPVYDVTNTKATVEITKMTDATQDLYDVKLVHVDGAWKVDDVMCSPPTQ